jgi:hypothetical protein
MWVSAAFDDHDEASGMPWRPEVISRIKPHRDELVDKVVDMAVFKGFTDPEVFQIAAGVLCNDHIEPNDQRLRALRWAMDSNAIRNKTARFRAERLLEDWVPTPPLPDEDDPFGAIPASNQTEAPGPSP